MPQTTVRVPWAPFELEDRRLTDIRGVNTVSLLPRYSTRAEWETRKTRLRLRLLLAAGLWPLPERTPLCAVVSDRQEREGYSIQKVHFQSFPGFYVAGSLFRPSGIEPAAKCPGVLNPHGHFGRGRLSQDELTDDPRGCANLALRGYVAFQYDMVGYNDSRQVSHLHFDCARGRLWNAGSFGLQLWNSMRALDFLGGLPDVDAGRLGCAGASGGGTQTFFLAAIDERIGTCAPVNMISASFQGGCTCENAPCLRLGTSNVEIAALVAPRPMLLVSATGDWTSTTPQVEYPAIRGIYELYSSRGALESVQVDAGHNYNRESREAVYRFFARHFSAAGSGGSVPTEMETPAETDEVLRVFPDSVPLPAGHRGAEEVRGWFGERVMESLGRSWPHDAEALEAFRREHKLLLAETLGLEVPQENDVVTRVVAEAGSDALRWRGYLVGTKKGGETVPAVLLKSTGDRGRPILLAQPGGLQGLLPTTGAAFRPSGAIAGLLAAGRTVMLFDAFLTGVWLDPTSLCGRPVLAPHFTTFNPSDCALRVHDVVLASKALSLLTGSRELDMVGDGEAGLWCVLARPFCPEARFLAADVARFDPTSDSGYLERLFIPGIRYIGDLRMALALAAPARTLLHGAGTPRPWEPLRSLYRGLDAPERSRVEWSRRGIRSLLR